jgi:hypothetical protein
MQFAGLYEREAKVSAECRGVALRGPRLGGTFLNDCCWDHRAIARSWPTTDSEFAFVWLIASD